MLQELESEACKLFFARENFNNQINQINNRLTQIVQLIEQERKKETTAETPPKATPTKGK